MAEELQRIINSLSSDLGTSALVEDAEHRTVVYSTRPAPVDDALHTSIMRREADEALVARVRQLGLAMANDPVYVSGGAVEGLVGRVCVPLRLGEELLGFLWLLDPSGHIHSDAEALGRVRLDCERVAQILFEQRQADRLLSEVLARLISPDAAVRGRAVAVIADRGVFPQFPTVAAIVATTTRPRSAQRERERAAVRSAIADTLAEVSASQSWTNVLGAALPDHLALLFPVGRAGIADEVGAVAEQVRAALARQLSRHAERSGLLAVVGIGDPQTPLIDAHLSYRQARLAANVAGVLSTVSSSVRWCDLGVFRTLAQLPSWEANAMEFDPRFVAVLEHCDLETVRSLEIFLGHAGDIKRTADELHVHRHTVYYRLTKIEKVSGLDLRDGDDRLVAHLGLKLARLAGIYNGEQSV